jgi:hypothetical protein
VRSCSAGQIKRSLLTAAGLGRYLEREGMALPDADTNELNRYSQECGRTRAGRRIDRNTGLSTIQALLRPYGVSTSRNRLGRQTSGSNSSKHINETFEV